jgi:hypothetical protein
MRATVRTLLSKTDKGRFLGLILLVLYCSIWRASASLGPWGDVQRQTILLEPPDDYLSSARFRSEELDWFVPVEGRTNFLQQLDSFDLLREQRAKLQDITHWRTTTNGWRYAPDSDLLFGLSSLARGQIYLLLSKYPKNIFHTNPFVLHDADADISLAGSGLTLETIRTVKQLLYKRGPSWCFSDMRVFEQLPADEFKRLLKALNRTPSVILELHVSPESDVSALVRYWGKHGSEAEVRTLLESLVKVPGGAAVDIAHLLPRFARERLYRFPDKSHPESVAREQCFWSALNFFNKEPDDRFAKTKYVNEALAGNYYRVHDDPAFGDLVVLADESGHIMHCSVYIADDTVFTKNGGYLVIPWTLMKIPEMMARYSVIGARQILTLRPKPTSTAAIDRP